MFVKVEDNTVKIKDFEISCLAFHPEKIKTLAIFTHGYTSSKADLLSWGMKASQMGALTIIFDLPGHLLGRSSPISTLQEFEDVAHQIFLEIFNSYKIYLKNITPSVFIGGHSLGAFLALKSATLNWGDVKKEIIAIGFGANRDRPITPPLDDLWQIRGQLISPSLAPNFFFPWFAKEKDKLKLQNEIIHLVVGKDDQLVSVNAAHELKDFLSKQNTVTLDLVESLPHHQVELASPYVRKYLKKFMDV